MCVYFCVCTLRAKKNQSQIPCVHTYLANKADSDSVSDSDTK